MKMRRRVFGWGLAFVSMGWVPGHPSRGEAHGVVGSAHPRPGCQNIRLNSGNGRCCYPETVRRLSHTGPETGLWLIFSAIVSCAMR